MAQAVAAKALHYTGDREADELLAQDALAFLIGFVLDQQVPIEWAFNGPIEIKRRMGKLDARAIAKADPEKIRTVFLTKPPLHRYPASMAERVQQLCRLLVERYQGDAANIFTGLADAEELAKRLGELPGIGPMKVVTIIAVCGKQLGIQPAGWEKLLPAHMTLGDVDSAETLLQYREMKRARKAEMKAEAAKKPAAARPTRKPPARPKSPARR
ncbi:MAG: HhH-GPD-type base excision DNA repair protein [Candidatus Dormibacteria bacterium]